MAPMVAILEIFKPCLLQNGKLNWAQTWEALQWHIDLELLNRFRSNIQDGCHGGQLEKVETTSVLER